jgi:hypothetical protein
VRRRQQIDIERNQEPHHRPDPSWAELMKHNDNVRSLAVASIQGSQSTSQARAILRQNC